MPYKGVGSFRRAARAKTPQYQELHYERRDTKEYEEWGAVLGKKMPVTLDEFRKMKYNDSNKFYRLTGYKKAQEVSDIPDTVNFDEYEKVGKRIERELVGLKTADGVEVKGFVNHFIDRLIGQTPAGKPIKHRREGVSIEAVKDCILNGSRTETVRIDKKTGERSITYTIEKYQVTINPDTGNLVQTNPTRRKQK
jgi:hypothetical protein